MSAARCYTRYSRAVSATVRRAWNFGLSVLHHRLSPVLFGLYTAWYPPIVFDRDRLDLGILEQGLVALLPTVPRLLEPAKRELDAATRAVGVYEHLPGPNLSGKPVRLADIAGPHRGDQAVVRSVGYLGGLFDALEGGCRQHGAEHLFLSQPVSGSYTTEEGRLEEVATAQPIFPYDVAT